MSILLQAERLIAGIVESNANVIFDSTVISAGNISYDNATGVITIQEAGQQVLPATPARPEQPF